MTAALTGKVDAVKLLLAHGANVNVAGAQQRPDRADVGRLGGQRRRRRVC